MEDNLRAYCYIVLNDSLVIQDLKVVEGAHGLFISMPSRKVTDRCHQCDCKNHLRARYCNNCGVQLKKGCVKYKSDGRPELHQDICYPINSAGRIYLESVVLKAFREEVEKSKQPGYICAYDNTGSALVEV